MQQQKMTTHEFFAARLWIDGGGTWLICFHDEISIGHAMSAARERIGIQSDLLETHAVWRRTEQGDELSPVGGVFIDQEEITSSVFLKPKTRIKLGDHVDLLYEVPSALTDSAKLTLNSGHRFHGGDQGIILLETACLIGKNSTCHIHCPLMNVSLIFFCRGNEFRWRPDLPGADSYPVVNDFVLEHDNVRIRIEGIC